MDIKKAEEIGLVSDRIQKLLISFFDELIEQFPSEQDFVSIRILISNKSIPMSKFIDMWIIDFERDKDLVKKRDPSFFTVDGGTFSKIGKASILESFRRSWKIVHQDKENEDTIWKWMDSLIILIERYKKLKESIGF